MTKSILGFTLIQIILFSALAFPSIGADYKIQSGERKEWISQGAPKISSWRREFIQAGSAADEINNYIWTDKNDQGRAEVRKRRALISKFANRTYCREYQSKLDENKDRVWWYNYHAIDETTPPNWARITRDKLSWCQAVIKTSPTSFRNLDCVFWDGIGRGEHGCYIQNIQNGMVEITKLVFPHNKLTGNFYNGDIISISGDLPRITDGSNRQVDLTKLHSVKLLVEEGVVVPETLTGSEPSNMYKRGFDSLPIAHSENSNFFQRLMSSVGAIFYVK